MLEEATETGHVIGEITKTPDEVKGTIGIPGTEKVITEAVLKDIKKGIPKEQIAGNLIGGVHTLEKGFGPKPPITLPEAPGNKAPK